MRAGRLTCESSFSQSETLTLLHILPVHKSSRSFTQNPWRTFFVLLTLTGMWAGEALGLQWEDIDFDHQCIHIRRSVWYGKAQSTKSKGSAAPITLPAVLSAVLAEYKANWKPNPDGYLFVTRNDRPPSSNKVVEYQLWPILDALGIKRCGLHAFRHSVASFIVDAGYSIEVAQQQLRHSNARTTLGYTHFRGGVTEQAMTDVLNSFKLDAVGRGEDMGSFPYTNVRFRWKEILAAKEDLDETAQTWSPLTNAFQQLPFRFLNKVDSGFACTLRKEQRLEGFRSYLRRLWNTVGGELDIAKAEPLARDFRDELTQASSEAQAEWGAIERDFAQRAVPTIGTALVTGIFSPVIAASGLAVAGLGEIIQEEMKRREFRKKVPMSVFIDLERK